MATRLRFRRPTTRATDDLGLGVKPGARRGVNKDGTFNLHRAGLPRFRPYEFYHQLISMPLHRFVGLLILGYLLANLCFGSIYLLVGMEHFARSGAQGARAETLDAFFFSAQTLTTVGYGHIYPTSPLANSVAAVESLVGLMSFALGCGLLYGRFSRPHARVRFTHRAVIGPYRGGRAFMFRIVNERSNQLIEVEASVSLSMNNPDTGLRTFHTLVLERTHINLFPSNWTIVHPLDETSPLAGLDESAIHAADVEFIVLIKAFDDTFAQTVYARSSYKAGELVWGARFASMVEVPEAGHPVVDLGRLDEIEAVDLPPA
ncbi:MAG TPA: ion channel [Holophagaceae bacterium]|nr:ion channel [Holophagaceae bacterium]